MAPPSSSVMFLAMVRPKPTPWTPLRVVFLSRVKGSKICFRNDSLMPTPVSRTSIL